ncbi:ARP2/3 actin-organizing complex subunit Sop2 [Mycoemilia scoparia]|uniref:Actin-related protein 2/3 complex subunit n=1 Tax=Mycoemilia scoparia TaxID=417184 RepID=A0A9W8DWQ0_9FUNG|nr:ARP2/3 actin-organizing complex subunit Sop2 [Mycoemilia scoparia]
MVKVSEFSFPNIVTAHAFNGDRSQVAVCMDSSEVHIYQRAGTNQWQKIQELKEHDLTVTCVDWAPQTNRIVTCSQDKNAYVWTFDEIRNVWKPTLVHLRLDRAATFVRWSPNEDKFAVGSGSKSIAVCYFGEDNDWWVSKHIKKPLTSTVLCIAWHPNNVLLACGGADSKARVFSAYVKGVDQKPAPSVWGERLPFNTLCGEYESLANGWVHGVAFSPSGNELAFIAHDSTLNFAYPEHNQAVSIRSTSLPFKSISWPADHVVLVSGHDCTPVIYVQTEKGWVTGKKVDDSRNTSRPISPSSSSGNSAFNIFRQMDSRKQASAAGIGGASSSTHQNTITDLRSEGVSGQGFQFSTSSLEGKLVEWSVSA